MLARFNTDCGEFDVRLALEAAPVTAGYFRELIEKGALDQTSFFRIVSEKNASLRAENPIEVIQGGLRETAPQTVKPAEHEPTSKTGLLHKKWSLSTARFGPGETYGSFFICMRDEPGLDHGGSRHPDGLGFAAFGEVVNGFEVVTAIFQKAEVEEYLQKQVGIGSCRLLSGS